MNTAQEMLLQKFGALSIPKPLLALETAMWQATSREHQLLRIHGAEKLQYKLTQLHGHPWIQLQRFLFRAKHKLEDLQHFFKPANMRSRIEAWSNEIVAPVERKLDFYDFRASGRPIVRDNRHAEKRSSDQRGARKASAENKAGLLRSFGEGIGLHSNTEHTASTERGNRDLSLNDAATALLGRASAAPLSEPSSSSDSRAKDRLSKMRSRRNLSSN